MLLQNYSRGGRKFRCGCALEGSLMTPVPTFSTERGTCYLMDLWGRLCLAIGRGLAPRAELSISCVTNEARACRQCNTYRAPASVTSPTKRERALKQYGSRSCISYVGNEARACLQAVWVTLLHQLRRQRSESVPASALGRAPASAASATK